MNAKIKYVLLRLNQKLPDAHVAGETSAQNMGVQKESDL